LGISTGIVSGMNDDIPSGAEIDGMSDQDRKVLENRLRRAAGRQGLRLEKSRLRDPRAIGYGTFRLVDGESNTVVLKDDSPRGYGVGLRDIARYLYEADDGR
jgi:hypothetical protein